MTFLIFSLPALAQAQPIHECIDEQIALGFPDYLKQCSPVADDAEFLRRLYLDLTGTIPTAMEARVFLADKRPDKRAKVIDTLLNSPGYARRMTQHFNVVLMERRQGNHVPQPAWEEYLRTSFEQNKPYDQLVREILSADGVDAKLRPLAKFYLDRNLEPNLLTRDISKLFLGRNLQCAQCHDSPLVDDFKQEHYFGIYAFLSRSYLFPKPEVPTAVIAEKADGEVSFVNVFDKTKAQKSTGPRMPGHKAISEPKLEKGKEYKVAPANNVKPVPAFSRREQLAGQLTAGDNPQFARTACNRLWAMMMGRGLVNPLDMDHTDNPPSHPALLDLLTREFTAHKYDVKWLLREIALSKTYQRSSAVPTSLKKVPADRYLVGSLKPLAPEQFAMAMIQASGLRDADRLAAKTASEAQLDAKEAGRMQNFARLFSAQPGQTEENFLATLDQTLFLKNNIAVRNFIAPQAGNLVERAAKLKDDKALAEELFLSVFTRLPSDEERKDIAEALKDAKDRSAILVEVVWAMLASAEFRFNH
jgi:hypothetical protein